jgi:hypothetical protein
MRDMPLNAALRNNTSTVFENSLNNPAHATGAKRRSVSAPRDSRPGTLKMRPSTPQQDFDPNALFSCVMDFMSTESYPSPIRSRVKTIGGTRFPAKPIRPSLKQKKEDVKPAEEVQPVAIVFPTAATPAFKYFDVPRFAQVNTTMSRGDNRVSFTNMHEREYLLGNT